MAGGARLHPAFRHAGTPALLGIALLVGAGRLAAAVTAPPGLTWGCGAAAVVPAGVHLPAGSGMNWWALAAQLAALVLAAWWLPQLGAWLGETAKGWLPRQFDLYPLPAIATAGFDTTGSAGLTGRELGSHPRRGPPVAD